MAESWEWEYAVFQNGDDARPWRDPYVGDEGLKIAEEWIADTVAMGMPEGLFRIDKRKVQKWERHSG